ncbi:MAG: hypothetical protein HYZ68_00255 [Chloroflexi bacterium]|nr:hypothetical protein [Chloroflexota bacterium]
MTRRNYALAFGAVLGVGCLGACAFLALTFVLVGVGSPFAAATPTPSLTLNTPTPTSPALSETPTPPATPTGSGPTPTGEPTPTPPPGTLRFRVWRIIQPPPCEGRPLINGTVYDAQGKGLPGVRVRLYHRFGYQAFSTTWTLDRPGYYEFFMAPSSEDFMVEIVNPDGVRLSEVAKVHYESNCVSTVDWRANF